MELAKYHQLTQIEVNVDALGVLTIMQHGNMQYANIVSDCRHLLDQLHSPAILHVYREENGVEDRLAKEGCLMEPNKPPTVFAVPPVFVSSIFQHDQAGGIRYRKIKPMQDDDEAPRTLFAGNESDGVFTIGNAVLNSDLSMFCSSVSPDPICNTSQPRYTNMMLQMHHPLCGTLLIVKCIFIFRTKRN